MNRSPNVNVTETTKQLQALHRDEIALVEAQLPLIPPPGHAVIRIEKTLISAGTELAKSSGLTAGEFPITLGYSAAGTVVSAGTNDEGIAIGDRVSANAPHATYALIPTKKMAKMPDDVRFEDATFGTLAALTLHAARMPKIEVGEACAIVGFGVVGQLIALWARAAGAKSVSVIEHRPYREALARKLGFQIAQDGSYPVVFEAAGSPSALQKALSMAERNGRVVAAGSLREAATVDVYRDVHLRGIALMGAHGSLQNDVSVRWTERKNRETALAFMSNGRLPVSELISHRLEAESFDEGFHLLKERAANAVILDWASAHNDSTYAETSLTSRSESVPG